MPRIHADRRQAPIAPEPIAPDRAGHAVQRKADYASQSAALSPFEPDRAVQRKADYASQSEALSPFAAAERGTSGSGGKLPHLDAIQKSFGKYDMSDVSFHGGPEAVGANRELGSQAFAYGNSVAAGRSLDLATTAHEAAHVVQQRGGKAPADGIGRSGDPYENHADQVSEAVVAGRSAEPILDAMTGGSSEARSGSAAVQQKAVQPFMGGLGDMASAALDAFTSDDDKDSGDSDKDSGAANKKSGKSESDNERDEQEGGGTLLGGIGTLIGTVLKAAAQTPAETEAPAIKSGIYDSKGRKLPGFWNQETQLNGLVKIIKRLEPFADPEWEVTKSETPDKGAETPTHYKFTALPGATWDPPFEGEYYDLLKHLQNRITSNPKFSPSAVWMPSWAPKKAKDYVDNKEYAAGKRSAIFINEGTGLLLWVDDSTASTKFEMMALMPANRKVYEDKAKAAGLDPEGRYGADFLKEMAMINNQDYQDLVLCNLLSPTQARKFLVGVGKDVALIMAAGVMNLYSPQATFAKAPAKALMDAVGSYAGYHAAKQEKAGFDSIKDREKKPEVSEAPGGYYKGGVCSE